MDFMPSVPELLQPVYEALVLTVVVVVLTRLNGLKSFAVMSSFDFAVTIALGSTIAGVLVSKNSGILVGSLAILAIFAVQALISEFRKRSSRFSRAIDNSPLLLMQGGKIFHDNLSAANITKGDLAARLRINNVRDPKDVQAVIFETTGEISVVPTRAENSELDDMLMEGVRRTPR